MNKCCIYRGDMQSYDHVHSLYSLNIIQLHYLQPNTVNKMDRW